MINVQFTTDDLTEFELTQTETNEFVIVLHFPKVKHVITHKDLKANSALQLIDSMLVGQVVECVIPPLTIETKVPATFQIARDILEIATEKIVDYHKTAVEIYLNEYFNSSKPLLELAAQF